jgi:ankyrin repeat protein
MPLHVAGVRDNSNIAEVLLDYHAIIDAGDDEDRTALHWAAISDSLSCAEVILRRMQRQRDVLARNGLPQDIVQSPVEIVDASGWTPLHWAAYRGCPRMVKLLLAYNARTQMQTKTKPLWTPLHCAAAGLAAMSTGCPLQLPIIIEYPYDNTTESYLQVAELLTSCTSPHGPDMRVLQDEMQQTPLDVFKHRSRLSPGRGRQDLDNPHFILFKSLLAGRMDAEDHPSSPNQSSNSSSHKGQYLVTSSLTTHVTVHRPNQHEYHTTAMAAAQVHEVIFVHVTLFIARAHRSVLLQHRNVHTNNTRNK